MHQYSFHDLKKKLKLDFSTHKEIKIAVLADSATQLFCQSLKGYGYTVGINFIITETDYDQIQQTVLNENSDLYNSNPEFVIIFQHAKKLLSEFYKCSSQEKNSFAIDKINFINNLIKKISNKTDSKIIFFNFSEINDSVFGHFANKHTSSFLYQVRMLNLLLMQTAGVNKQLNILDLASLQNTFGSQIFLAKKFYITADNFLELDALPIVAQNITDIILAYTGRFKKCLVLDLDNTMWGGIIGDDGMEGIQIGDLGIGKAFTEFQLWIKQLKERGIILAVCSKNTEKLAKEPFISHPEMVLKLNDIAIFVANWNNKVDNILYIQSVLNIGLDSIVFLDDNPFEREMVKTAIPELAVPTLPEDPAEYLSYLYTLNLFETTSYTKEDKKRNNLYKEEASRTVLRQTFINEDEFLESLEMKAEIMPINSYSLPRGAQLTQRSNQFNLRTIRYSESELKAIIENPNKFTLTISLKDKLGDYGLISMIIGERTSNNDFFIETWIMSCRVLKRGVENLVLNELVHLCERLGCGNLIGEYISTSKNKLVENHYQKLGFEAKDNKHILTVLNYQHKPTFINKI